MNIMLINYCYSWYRTNVSIAELTSEPIERADRRASADRVV
nr:MAG TPA: hypothetical protein [Caudoviricetes sp.]